MIAQFGWSNRAVLLKAKSRHGKNRIHQHGDIWRVAGEGKFNGQPALSLSSVEKTDRGEFDGRWVLLNDDKDFEIIEDLSLIHI